MQNNAILVLYQFVDILEQRCNRVMNGELIYFLITNGTSFTYESTFSMKISVMSIWSTYISAGLNVMNDSSRVLPVNSQPCVTAVLVCVCDVVMNNSNA